MLPSKLDCTSLHFHHIAVSDCSLWMCVFEPFKKFYNKFADRWITSNPGKAITIYQGVEPFDFSGLGSVWVQQRF